MTETSMPLIELLQKQGEDRPSFGHRCRRAPGAMTVTSGCRASQVSTLPADVRP
ncbi:MAG TPA: hypothetical protein VMM59_10450 [Thermohalobaculum sp.]|nr:hypothetical protein [Thermohalobaculum sp.]